MVSDAAVQNKDKQQQHKKRCKALQMGNKVNSWVQDAHHKAAKSLIKQYDYVLVPYSCVLGMVKRQMDWKLTSKTCSQCGMFWHGCWLLLSLVRGYGFIPFCFVMFRRQTSGTSRVIE